MKASAFSNYKCSNNLITTSKISTTTNQPSTAQTTTKQVFQRPKILALHGGGGSASSLSQGLTLQLPEIH